MTDRSVIKMLTAVSPLASHWMHFLVVLQRLIISTQVLTAPKLRKTREHGQYYVSYTITEKQQICSITAKEVTNLDLATTAQNQRTWPVSCLIRNHREARDMQHHREGRQKSGAGYTWWLCHDPRCMGERTARRHGIPA